MRKMEPQDETNEENGGESLEESLPRWRRFLRGIEGTYFYLIPITLTVTYAIIAYTPQEILSNDVKLGMVCVIGLATLAALYLWIVRSEVPSKLSQLELKSRELETKEGEFLKRRADIEGRLKEHEDTLNHFKYPIRYLQFRRDVVLTENIGESVQTWDLIVQNVSDNDIYEIVIPVKKFDLYEAFTKKFEELQKQNPEDSEDKIRMRAFLEIEQVLDVVVGEKSLNPSMIQGLIHDLTIESRSYALRGRYADELTPGGKGFLAEIVYRIPLEDENRLEPGKPKRIALKIRNKCSFAKVLEGEVTSLRVERFYDEATITIRCPDGFNITRNPVENARTGLKVVDAATKTPDKAELDRVASVHIDPDHKRLVWTITMPKVGYLYIIHFKIQPISPS